MKIGDRFIAERFDTVDYCDFNQKMEEFVGKSCKIIDGSEFAFCEENLKIGCYVEFDTGNRYIWLKSALKPIN